MNCTLAALVACFSWSGFYVDGALAIADAPIDAAHDFARNPYGRVTLGYDVTLSRAWSAALELTHFSSIDSKYDRGVNFAILSVRWRPFGRQ